MNTIDWDAYRAAIWRSYSQQLRPVASGDIDPVDVIDLHGLTRQKAAVIDNTQQFIDGQPSNHALLWGSRGTGKSSLIKAVFNHFSDTRLRLIQLDKSQLTALPQLTDELRNLPYRFMVFVDDLAFETGDHSYQPLKSILEGSIERPPDNLRLYATSNRRHLVTEHQQDNQNTELIDGELHYTDTVEEKISLSDRFGLWVAFHPARLADYFALVTQLFANHSMDTEALHNAARLYAMGRGSHSPRTAQQFYREYAAKL